MKRHQSHNHAFCGRAPRRQFLTDVGMGFTGLALGAMLQGENLTRAAEHDSAWSPPDGRPQFQPRATKVVWIFLSGGYSQMETFDPKPMLTKYADKTYDETEFPNPTKDPLFEERSRAVVGGDRPHSRIFPMQVGYRKRGEASIEITDWWPHFGECVDDVAFVRSMYTTDNDHAAEFQIHHGRHKLDPPQPVIGSWIHYGLGTLNENLPQFVFIGEAKHPLQKQDFYAGYLGPQYSGVELSLDPKNPLPFGAKLPGVLAQEQRNQFDFIGEINKLAGVEYPHDEQLRARIKSYELAYRMQSSVPEAIDMSGETEETAKLYGIDNKTTEVYGRRLLAARRMCERGVRFTLAYLSDYGEWDSHLDLKKLHARSCERVDKPVAGFLKDMKRRGLLDDTVVVFCTEFGRTPGLEVSQFHKIFTGRDHHPHGFTIWFAGAGIKKGHVYGRTDELGFHAVENPHYVTDIHATLLHLLGLEPHRLDVPGRQRLEIDHGKPIYGILS